VGKAGRDRRRNREGLTTEEKELFLSERTVENHVSKILGKLGLASRAEIPAWPTERGLLAPDPD